MESGDLPLILIEVVLVFGGVLAFGWWQLRDVRRAREKTAADKAAAHLQAAKSSSDPPAPPPG